MPDLSNLTVKDLRMIYHPDEFTDDEIIKKMDVKGILKEKISEPMLEPIYSRLENILKDIEQKERLEDLRQLCFLFD